MDTESMEIGRQLRRITGTVKGSFPVMSGKVTAYDETDNSVSIILTMGDTEGETDDIPSVVIEGIMNNVSSGNFGGVYMVPTIGADCEVMEIDGAGKWEMIKASSYDKVIIQGNILVQFNDGSNGGLTITPELKTQLAKNNALLSHLITVINGVVIDEPGSGAASALQAALKTAIAADELGDFSNIEDTKVKH